MAWTELENGGVLAPQGFTGQAAACGIKQIDSEKPDLAIFTTDGPTVSAATFTTNRVQASPVRLSKQHMKTSNGDMRAVVVNSGNANACNGQAGDTAAKSMADTTALALGVNPEQVFVCSTGVIGVPMPMDRILPRIPETAQDLQRDSQPLARAIMTSDTVEKRRALSLDIGGKTVVLGGMAKGAGMINPNMATMLCFITTDASVDRDWLHENVGRAVERSFNRISIDGDMSTNDTVLVLANGQTGNPVLDGAGPESEQFSQALDDLMLYLAKTIVRDGEKVTKFVELHVKGAASEGDARLAAKAVANSFLVKAAWNGSGAYWGRIMDALGYSGAVFDPDKVSIDYEDRPAVRNGCGTRLAQSELDEITRRNEFSITMNLGTGSAGHTVYTTDISQGFIEFNQVE